MSILFELRNAARVTPEGPLKTALSTTADELQEAFKEIHKHWHAEDLQLINGLWAKAEQLLSQVTTTPPNQGGGALPVPLAEAA